MPSQQLERECTRAITGQKIFAGLCPFIKIKGDFKIFTKRINDTLKTLTYKLENDGMYGSKCCF